MRKYIQKQGATRIYRIFFQEPFLKNISTVKGLLITGTFWWQTVPLLSGHLLVFLASHACKYAQCFFSALLKGHLSTLTEIMVAAWSIGLGVLLLLFFSHCFGDQQLFLIILVTIIDYFYFFNYILSSCKFYHDCILATKKCEKNKTKQKNWLDTLTSKEK